MAFTQTQLDAIEVAIASGTLTVEYDGRRITYQSTEALLKARSVIKQALATQAGTGSSGRRFVTFSSGL